MSEIICGYKNIPVTGYTRNGPFSTVIGLTYIRIGHQMEFLESWINPMIGNRLDSTEKAIFVEDAKRRLMAQLELHLQRYPYQPYNWNGVAYG